jgi:hypothetical protein
MTSSLHAMVIGADGQLGHVSLRGFPGCGRMTPVADRDVDICGHLATPNALNEYRVGRRDAARIADCQDH